MMWSKYFSIFQQILFYKCLILLNVIMLSFVGLAGAATYGLPNGTLPAGCSRSGGTVTCGNVNLAWNDIINVSGNNRTLNINGDANLSNAKINIGGSVADLTINITGNLTTSSSFRSIANINVGGSANLASANHLTGNLTANSIQTNNNTTIVGDLVGGTVSTGSSNSVTGNISGSVITVNSSNSTINGSIQATSNVHISSGSTVNGNISGANITTTSAVALNGNIAASGDFTLASGSSVSGNVTAATITLLSSNANIVGSATADETITLNWNGVVNGDATAPHIVSNGGHVHGGTYCNTSGGSTPVVCSSGGGDCSLYIGDATINEVHAAGNNTRFIEIKMLDEGIPKSEYDTWSLEFCSSRRSPCQTVSLGSATFDQSTYPWLVLTKSGITHQNYIDFGHGAGSGMEIRLNDSQGRAIDYLSVDNYTSSLNVSCSFSYETTMWSVNSHTIMRLPDGTGDWAITGPGNSGKPTEGYSNDGDDPPPLTLDHFEFVHDGHGLTCATETVTLRACADANCLVAYSGDVNVVLPDIGWLDGNSQLLTFPASGQVDLLLKHTVPEPVTLNVVSSDPTVNDSVVCEDGSGTSCQIVFADSGFLLTVENGRSCTDLAGMIQAVSSDRNGNEVTCVGNDSFANTTRDVGFRFEYVAPNSGTTPPKRPEINGTLLDSASFTTVPGIVFNNEAIGTFSLSYNDAGSLNLHALFEGSGDEAGLIMEGSTASSFIVAPERFVVTSPLNNSGSSGDPKLAAGEEFAATVTAVCEDGTVTKNFAADTTLLPVSPYQPTGGALGDLDNGALAVTDFEDGSATTENLTYDEVGNFTLQAQTLNYLDSGMDVSGSVLVGRFHPHHFTVTESILVNRSDAECNPQSIFTYMDEPFELQIELEARNKGDDVTTNYHGDLLTFAQLNFGAADIDPDTGDITPLTSRLDYDGTESVTFDEGAADFTVEMLFSRDDVPDGPYENLHIGIAPDDSEVKLLDSALDIDLNDTGSYTHKVLDETKIRYGRISLENAFGSELLNLKMPLVVEYFNLGGFETNTIDNCTELDLEDHLVLNVDKDDVGGWETGDLPIQVGDGSTSALMANSPMVNGDAGLSFIAPGTGNSGSFYVRTNITDKYPWLQFDWNGDGDENPTARATFGIFKGNPRLIYMRESVW